MPMPWSIGPSQWLNFTHLLLTCKCCDGEETKLEELLVVESRQLSGVLLSMVSPHQTTGDVITGKDAALFKQQ